MRSAALPIRKSIGRGPTGNGATPHPPLQCRAARYASVGTGNLGAACRWATPTPWVARPSAPAPAPSSSVSQQPGARTGPLRRPLARCSAAADVARSGSPESENDRPHNNFKLMGLGGLFFCSTFAYTILQNLKDSIIVTSVGAEALPFLEAYGVLPASLTFFVLYNNMTTRIPERWWYQAALLPFVAFYAIFAFVLYPNAAALHPTHLLDNFKSAMPAGFAGLAGMVIHWTYSLFFIIGELWGGVAISLLFWGFADEVCTMHEAETVYPLLGILANVGLVMAGAWIKLVSANAPLWAGVGLSPVQVLLSTILLVAVGLFTVKDFVHERFATPEVVKVPRKGKKSKPQKSLGESLSILKKSPKVGNLAVLVIAYFISQKLFDFAWKAQLRVMYPSSGAYQGVLAEVAQWTGITTIALMATSKFVFKFGGWASAALVTPVAVLVSGAAFFGSAIAMQGGAASLGPQAVAALLAISGVAGAVGRVASRAPKYSLFDPAKEMVYITMKKEEKNEGKAAVDLLGSYFGKSGASWIMQILVLTMGSLTAAMPIMALVHVTVGLVWTRATFSLADIMKTAKAEHEEQEAAAELAQAAALASRSSPEPPGPTNNGYRRMNGNGGSDSASPSPAPPDVGMPGIASAGVASFR